MIRKTLAAPTATMALAFAAGGGIFATITE
jgi:hypothetical protein